MGFSDYKKNAPSWRVFLLIYCSVARFADCIGVLGDIAVYVANLDVRPVAALMEQGDLAVYVHRRQDFARAGRTRVDLITAVTGLFHGHVLGLGVAQHNAVGGNIAGHLAGRDIDVIVFTAQNRNRGAGFERSHHLGRRAGSGADIRLFGHRSANRVIVPDDGRIRRRYDLGGLVRVFGSFGRFVRVRVFVRIRIRRIAGRIAGFLQILTPDITALTVVADMIPAAVIGLIAELRNYSTLAQAGQDLSAAGIGSAEIDKRSPVRPAYGCCFS